MSTNDDMNNIPVGFAAYEAPPPTVGYLWLIPPPQGLAISMTKRPVWWRLVLLRIFLGATWEAKA